MSKDLKALIVKGAILKSQRWNVEPDNRVYGCWLLVWSAAWGHIAFEVEFEYLSRQ